MRSIFGLTVWTLSLVAGRIHVSGSPRYQWLYWDIFLALLPLLAAVVIERRPRFARLLLVPWLLFLPNAPYLMTELIHLRIPDRAPHWLDICMLVSVAMLGLVAGAMSMRRVLSVMPAAWRAPLEVGICALCGFGIYLGRYDRWNSWDVVAQPTALAMRLFDYVAHPAAHQGVWVVSAVFAGSIYFSQRVAALRYDDETWTSSPP